MTTVETRRLEGPWTIPSVWIVAALCESERRKSRRGWLSPLWSSFLRRESAGAGEQGSLAPGTGHSRRGAA